MKFTLIGATVMALLGGEALTLEEDYKARNALLVQISKGEKMMETGLAEQEKGAELVNSGKSLYQDGLTLKESAIEELNNSY